MTDRVKGKVALITGAGSVGPGWGNGKAAATLYAREGAKVFLVDYNLEAANETKGIIEQEGGDCTAFEADVTDSQAVEEMARACVGTYGRIDILHNNVGIIEVGGTGRDQRGKLGPAAGCQCEGDVSYLQVLYPADGEARGRRYRQHFFDCRHTLHGLSECLLQRFQGRHKPVDAEHRHAICGKGHQGELCSAGSDEHAFYHPRPPRRLF